MAWTAPMTFTASTGLTASQLNTHLRDNLLETAPAKAQKPGSIFVTTDVNQIAERQIVTAFVNPSQSTSSTSYTDLDTGGPHVTVNTGTTAMVWYRCGITVGGTNAARASIGVSGATSIEPSDNWSIRVTMSTGAGSVNAGSTHFFDNLIPGENTFTMKYMTGSGTGAFFDRYIAVMPL